MAITGGATVTVTSAAAQEWLPDQAQGGSGSIVFSNTIDNIDNGNLGYDSNKYASANFRDRLVIIRLDEVDEEVRYITGESAGTGTTRICTVHEDWDNPPASGDSAFLSYFPWDADTIGNDFKVLLKRETDWSTADEMVVGNGTDFAFFVLLDGHSIETVDNSSTTVADFAVESSGRFDVGYTSGGVPVSGGYMVGTPAVDGELVIDVKSGGYANLNDFFLTCVKKNMSWWLGYVNWVKAKLYKALYTIDLSGDITVMQNSVMEGTLDSNEYIQCDSTTNIESCAIVSTYGLRTKTTTGAETLTMSNVTFLNNETNILVYDDKTWNMVNPTWVIDTSTQDDIEFGGTTGVVNELFELNGQIVDSSNVAISGAELWIYEGTQGSGLNHHDTSDGDGVAAVEILTRTFESGNPGLDVTSYGDFALKVYEYGYTPVVSALGVSAPIDRVVTLLSDGAITESDQQTALQTGNGITATHWGDPSGYGAPATLLPFENGNLTTGSVGEDVIGQTSGASGVLVELVDGNWGDGRVFLNTRNDTAFQTGEIVEGKTSGWLASGVQPADYSWEVDCNSESMAVTYDFLSANMASGDPTTVFIDAIEWGEDEQSQLLYKATNYYTERNVALEEGVFFTNTGAGNWQYMTSDSGYQYVPPTTYTLTLTGLPSNTEVRLYRDDNDAYLDGTENSSTTWQYTYTYTGDIDVYAHILHLDYNWFKLTGVTLSDANQSVPVSLTPDRDYENPG